MNKPGFFKSVLTLSSLRIFSLSFILKIVGALCSVFFQYLLAKNFSIEDVGIFNTLFSIFNLSIIVFSFGIPKAILKISSHFYSNHENQNLINFLVFALKKQIFTILIICIILFVVLLYFPLNNISGIEKNMILTFIVSIPFLALVLSFSEFFKATKKPK